MDNNFNLDFETQTILRRLRANREQLFNFCTHNLITLVPFWSPDQPFIEPPVIDESSETYASVLVLVMTLDHGNVPADQWVLVQSGLFNWSSSIVTVSKPGDLGGIDQIKRRKRDCFNWILIETNSAIEWQRWREWPKIQMPRVA